MSRLRRPVRTGKIFFVTCNLARHVSPLSPRERDLFLEVLAEVRDRLRFRLFAYVVMPTHWHALILPAPEQSISCILHSIKRRSALCINGERRQAGPLWQARFFDRFLRRVADFHEAASYIHTNPGRDGFVSDDSEWPWSSYEQFLGRSHHGLRADTIQLPFESDSPI
jgi:putative transposase